MICTLLQHPKCNVNAKNYLGETPLHVAKSLSAVMRLVEKGGTVSARDNSDNVPLHRQVKKVEICNFLLENGAPLNVRNVTGFTPLHEAVFHNVQETVELFLRNGAFVNAENNNRYRITPLQIAYRCRANECIKKQLLRRSAPIYLLFAASYDNSTIPEVLKEWSSVQRKQETLVNFLFDLINLMKNSKDLKMVTCGQLVAKYFLSTVSIVGDQTLRVLKKLSEYFGRSLLNFLLKTHDYNEYDSLKKIQETVTVLVDHGEILDYSDLEVIYLQFGDVPLLHELCKFPVVPKTRHLYQLPFFLRVIWDVTTNIPQVIKSKYISNVQILDFFNTHNLARYCTLPPTLYRHFFDSYRNIVRFEKPELGTPNMEECMKEIEKNCGIPTLLELSRNTVRPMLARRYRVNRVYDLYQVLMQTGVPPLIVSIIIMEMPLHNNVKIPEYIPYTRHIYLL